MVRAAPGRHLLLEFLACRAEKELPGVTDLHDRILELLAERPVAARDIQKGYRSSPVFS